MSNVIQCPGERRRIVESRLVSKQEAPLAADTGIAPWSMELHETALEGTYRLEIVGDYADTSAAMGAWLKHRQGLRADRNAE